MIFIGRVRTEARTFDGAAGTVRLGPRVVSWRARRVGAVLVLEIPDYLPFGEAWTWRAGRWLHRGPFGGPFRPLPPGIATFWAPLLEHVERTLLGWRPELVRGGLAGLSGHAGTRMRLQNWPRKVLPFYAPLYHGTDVRGFRVPNGPAFFSTSLDVAGFYSRWKHDAGGMYGKPEATRILTFRLKRSPDLLFLDDELDLARLAAVLGPGAEAYLDPREVARALCRTRAADGWTTGPYWPDGPETMLCRPGVFVAFDTEDPAGLGALLRDRHLGPVPPMRDPRARMLALVAVAVPTAPVKVRAAIFERALEFRRQGARDPIRAAVLHEAALAVAALRADEARVLASWGWHPAGLVAGTER